MTKLLNIIRFKGKNLDNTNNTGVINEDIVDVNNIITDDMIEITIDIGDYQPSKIYIKKQNEKERNKKSIV